LGNIGQIGKWFHFGYFEVMKAESMVAKILVFVVLLLFLPANLSAVDTRKIAVVQNKDVLDSSDFGVIDDFVEEAVRELVEAKDFSDISKLRSDFVTNSISKKDSSSAQYRNQFTKSAVEHISGALKSSQSFAADRRFKVVLNLLIVIESLGDVQLSTLVLDKLDDNNAALRYWALKCFASPEVIRQLNDAGNSSLSAQVISRIGKVVEKCDDALLILIANFASEIKEEQAMELLNRIADMRIKQYFGWQVEDELTDMVILKSLYDKIISGQGGADSARRFAQLYSYVFQRYLKGTGKLSELHKQKLVTVMVEIEDKCISKLLGKQTKIREAIGKKDNEALLREHDNLLGNANTEGKLPAKLNFVYRGPDGRESTAPLALPPPG
jgi:hypothetical protein